MDYGLFRNNYIHDFPDLAFYAKGGSRYTVAEGNVITNQYPSWPGPAVGFGQETDEQFMHGATFQTYYMVIRNNIFANCSGGAVGSYSCYHAYFYNNLTYNCGDPAKNQASSGSAPPATPSTPNTEGVMCLTTSSWTPAAACPLSTATTPAISPTGSMITITTTTAANPFRRRDVRSPPGAAFHLGNPHSASAAPPPRPRPGSITTFVRRRPQRLLRTAAPHARGTPLPGVLRDIEGQRASARRHLGHGPL